MFIKFAPLIDPIKYMIGKYNKNKEIDMCVLPNLKNNDEVYKKVKDIKSIKGSKYSCKAYAITADRSKKYNKHFH